MLRPRHPSAAMTNLKDNPRRLRRLIRRLHTYGMYKDNTHIRMTLPVVHSLYAATRGGFAKQRAINAALAAKA